MKILFLNFLRLWMIVIYAPLKLLPIQKNKVVFISRQTNGVNLDYRLLQGYVKKQNPDVRYVNICRRYEKGFGEYAAFVGNILKSLYHLATTSVCVIDGYWPAVSMLNHKKALTVVQIWHAMGKIKKSGYQSLNKKSGRNPKVAKAMAMHKNYDVIIASGKAWNKFYCESFGVSEDVLLNCGLPRIDAMLEADEANRTKILQTYPELEGKTVLLYAPTFRKGWNADWDKLSNSLDYDKFALIVKNHPNQKLKISDKCYTCDEFTSDELLSVSDYLITDYSAIAVEGAILDVKTYYYVYDYEKYIENNGLNIDLFEEMPGCVFKKAEDLIDALNKPYPQQSLDNYKAKFLPENLGTSTQTVGNYILKSIKK
ncbi:MAG: CDP-glycerol glycerophosphotransferase family protein [Eubacterium sp.]|nr:CDP-glycerol glycerophosphotransferase family protein [Eubacterium sp.]